jgi:hypothetical protein
MVFFGGCADVFSETSGLRFWVRADGFLGGLVFGVFWRAVRLGGPC